MTMKREVVDWDDRPWNTKSKGTLTDAAVPDLISFVGLAPPPSSCSVYWLIANHSCHFLRGLPSDCGSSLAWKCLEGFVESLKPLAGCSGVMKAQSRASRFGIYAQEPPAGSGRKCPLPTSSALFCFSRFWGFSWEPSRSKSHAHRTPAQALLVRNLTKTVSLPVKCLVNCFVVRNEDVYIHNFTCKAASKSLDEISKWWILCYLLF